MNVLLERCPPWRRVRLEACPPGGVSAWRHVRLEACPPGGLSAGEMTANRRLLSDMLVSLYSELKAEKEPKDNEVGFFEAVLHGFVEVYTWICRSL